MIKEALEGEFPGATIDVQLMALTAKSGDQ